MDMHTVFKEIEKMRDQLAKRANEPIEKGMEDLIGTTLPMQGVKNQFAFAGQVALDALKMRLEKLEEQYLAEMALDYERQREE